MQSIRLLGVLLALCVAANAAPEDPVWKQLDRDGDTMLSREEAPPRMKPVFDAVDADGDGKVSQAEWRGHKLSEKPRPRQAATPKPDHDDLAYGPHARNKLDLWLPEGEGPFPLLVYFHGGGFVGGDKGNLKDEFRNALLERGIAVASSNYRLSYQAPYPAQMHDAARALQFLRAHAKEYHLDPKRVAASGGSAGAGISLWLATHEDLADPNNADPVLRESSRVCATVVHGAQSTYDPRKSFEVVKLEGIHPLLTKFFDIDSEEDLKDPAKIALFEDATPLYHVTPDDAPCFLFYAVPDKPITEATEMGDRIHHPVFGHLMKEAMDKAGVTCVLRLREDIQNGAQLTNEEADFLAKYLKE